MRKALVRALVAVESVEPDLGHHLRSSLATGVTCRYSPHRAGGSPPNVEDDGALRYSPQDMSVVSVAVRLEEGVRVVPAGGVRVAVLVKKPSA